MICEEMIDVAVELGLAPRELPPILSLKQLIAQAPETPPLIVDKLLHKGCKMILGGGSKSNKTWALLDLALSVASGTPWWGLKTTKANVLYLNFELPTWTLMRRIDAVCSAKPEIKSVGDTFNAWNLRGFAADLTTLRPELERGLDALDLGLVVIDPAYKLLGDRDENANGDIAQIMNEFERVAERTGAAVVIAHHFAKGDSSVKDPVDRMSGAGAWARDPDSIVVMTPHEEDYCYTVSTILRCLAQLPDFVVEWDYPLMKRAEDLDPATLRVRGAQKKSCTDRDFLAVVPTAPTSRKIVLEKAQELGLSTRTCDRYFKRLVAAGLMCSSSGLYWRKD